MAPYYDSTDSTGTSASNSGSNAWLSWTSSTGNTSGSGNTIWYTWQVSDGNDSQITTNKKSKAFEKAETLLKENLEQNQVEEYKKHKRVTIKLDDGRSFRIRLGRVKNLEELDKDGNLIARHCVHVKKHVPDPDNMLAQLLFLKTNPKALLELANTERVPIHAA